MHRTSHVDLGIPFPSWSTCSWCYRRCFILTHHFTHLHEVVARVPHLCVRHWLDGVTSLVSLTPLVLWGRSRSIFLICWNEETRCIGQVPPTLLPHPSLTWGFFMHSWSNRGEEMTVPPKRLFSSPSRPQILLGGIKRSLNSEQLIMWLCPHGGQAWGWGEWQCN